MTYAAEERDFGKVEAATENPENCEAKCVAQACFQDELVVTALRLITLVSILCSLAILNQLGAPAHLAGIAATMMQQFHHVVRPVSVVPRPVWMMWRAGSAVSTARRAFNFVWKRFSA